jgi:hypothetical protein
VAIPGVLEQVLSEEIVLRIQDQDLGPWLVLFEIVSDEGGALVRSGRAAERVTGRDDHEKAAVLHAFELLSQQPCLWPAIPGVRHGLRRALVVALDGAVFERNARGKDDAVVRQLRPTLKRYGLPHRIDRRHGVMDDVDAVSLR